MLVRMKLRNTRASEWRHKWLRARRRVRGILKIMRIVRRERRERIEKLNRQSLCSESYYDEIDEVSELYPIDERRGLDPLASMLGKK